MSSLYASRSMNDAEEHRVNCLLKKRFNATETICAFILDKFSSIPVMHADPFIAAVVCGWHLSLPLGQLGPELKGESALQ